MAPDAKRHDLLYISDYGTYEVSVFSYPEGKLKGMRSKDVVEFWKQGPDVAGADAVNLNVGLWRYPAGGSALKDLTNNFALPVGATVSKASAMR